MSDETARACLISCQPCRKEVKIEKEKSSVIKATESRFSDDVCLSEHYLSKIERSAWEKHQICKQAMSEYQPADRRNEFEQATAKIELRP